MLRAFYCAVHFTVLYTLLYFTLLHFTLHLYVMMELYCCASKTLFFWLAQKLEYLKVFLFCTVAIDSCPNARHFSAGTLWR